MSKFAVGVEAFGNDSQRLNYIMSQFLGSNAFITVGQVTEVTDDGLTLQPLIHSQDADGAMIEKPVVYGIPWFRLLSGTSAIIIDPAVGDIGVMVVCDRDITNVKSEKAASLPASDRTHSHADAIWLGGVGALNSTPELYIEFSGNATLNIVAPTEVNVTTGTANITADTTNVSGDATIGGDLTVTGEATIGGITFSSHVHGGVEPGNSKTSTPQ